MKDKVCEYNHLILYAKGHYRKTDILEDVSTILAHRSGLPYLSNRDVWKLVVTALEKHCPLGVANVLFQMFDPYFSQPYALEVSFYDDLEQLRHGIQLCLVELMKLQVYDQGVTLIELGVADENILPFSEAHIKSVTGDTGGGVQ